MRGARLGALAGPVLLLAACGGADAPDAPDELVAVPFPEDAVDESVDALEEHVVDTAPDALEQGAPGAGHGQPELKITGPPIEATRQFVAERDEQARVSDHLLADLTGDGASEVLVATVDEDDEAVVEVASWEGDDFRTTARLPLGRADDLGRLRLADLGERAPRVLVLALQHEGATRVAVWHPDENGGLQPPDECPLDSPVRVRSRLGLQLRLTCDADEASRRVLQWAHGAFWPSTLDREDVVQPDPADELAEVLADDGPTSAS